MNFFCKSKKYIKEEDEVYCGLLKLARVSDNIDYDSDELENAIATLNKLPVYAKVHQRIIPLLHAKARKLEIFNLLNKQAKQLLVTATQQGIITELAKVDQLTQILEVLLKKNIPVILLKGAAFNNVLYSYDAPRTSHDIDILVKKEHWQETVHLLKTIMNYKKKTGRVFDELCEISFTPKKVIGAALDLHISITYPFLFHINEELLWENSVPHPKLDNHNVRILSPEDSILHQAIHAFVDMNFCKYNLVDSHEIITQFQPNLKQTVKQAEVWGVTSALYQLLNACSKIMNTPIENEQMHILKPPEFLRYFASRVLNSSFDNKAYKKKQLRYRINQILSQIIFTKSIIRPMRLHWLYVKSAIRKKITCQ